MNAIDARAKTALSGGFPSELSENWRRFQSGIPTALRPDDLAEIEHCQSLQSTLKLKAMSYWFACWSYEIDTKVSTILLGNCLASSPFAVMDCPTIGNVTAQDKGEEE
jgi:hypothetical protein